MIKMKGCLCLIALLLLCGAWATPLPHEGDHSTVSKEHQDHLHHEKGQPHPHNEAHDAAVHELSPHNADFAFALYKIISSEDGGQPKNIFFSPLSISSVLSMLSVGAKGNTHKELFKALGYEEHSVNEVNEGYEHMFHSLGHSQGDLQLDIGGAVVIQENFKPVAKFLEDLKHYFEAKAFNVDFTKSDEAAKVINDFIAQKTEDKITDMVKDLDKDTIMLLISYIAFKGKWVKPFDGALTEKANFHVDENTTVTVDMMKRTGRYDYFHDSNNDTDILLLPYQGNASMMIVLPKEGKMKDVEDRISKEDVDRWHKSLVRSNLDVHMPKFSASGSYALNEPLKKMGIVEVFSDSADLSGISEEIGLKVSKVSHRAVLSVDEKGTEAAGVTTAEIMPMSMPTEVCMSRPFLMFIVEESTRSILFMGKIVNPTAH